MIGRLLYPCGEDIPLDVDGLLTADTELWKYTKLIGLDEFSKLPGAILLAEGGMGKSTVMRQLRSYFTNELSYLIELGLFAGDPVGLNAEMDLCFEMSRSAGPGFAVILDGLDEAPELAGIVLRKIRKLPNKATAWIASRDEPAIRAIQSDAPHLRPYTLAPLSLHAIQELAKQFAVDAERFIEAVGRNGITAICAKPMGCRLAISVFQENSLEGVRQVDLWHKGIRRLCDETPSKTRRIVSKSGYVLDEVVGCCAWIALCMVASNKNAIWDGEESHCPSSCASLSDIRSNEFSSELVAVSLRRGVFTPSGDARFRFSHTTYRDYLASLGFDRFIPPAHWSSLFLTRGKKGVLPQRAGVATWLAAQNSGFLEEISGIEPEILLASIDAIQAIGPVTLCKTLLDRSTAISYERRHSGPVANNLHRLSADGTSIVIRERLTSPDSSEAEIDFSIEIAWACGCADLSDVLVDRVLNPSLTLHQRVGASYAVHDLGDKTAKGQLKALLPLDPSSDPHDDLRGNILRCCWPDHISADDLLGSITPPQRSNYLGSYGMFLDFELPATFKEVLINEEVVCKFLEWSVRHITRDQPLDRLGRLARAIYSYCWQWALRPDVSKLLAVGYLSTLKLHITPFGESRGLLRPRNTFLLSREEFARQTDRRFAVLEALLNIDFDERILTYVPVNAYPLFGAEDIGSILEKALQDAKGPLAARWVACFKVMVSRIDIDQYSRQIERLNLARPDLIDSSSRLKQDAESYARRSQEWNQQWEREKEKNQRKRDSDQQRIDREIKSILEQEVPDRESFVGISIWLYSENGMTSLGSINVTESPGWEKLSPKNKEALVTLAERYLREGSIERTEPQHLTFSVAQAFTLLRLMRPDSYQELPESIWAKAAVELLKPAFGEYMESLGPLFNTLGQLFPRTAEAALIQTVLQQVASGHVSILRHWGDRLSDSQSEAILHLAQDPSLSIEARHAILAALVECGRGEAVVAYLNSLLKDLWNPHPDSSLNKHLLLAFSLSPESYAPQIIKAAEVDREWGKQWMEFAVMDAFKNFDASFASCNPDLIASVYIWLHNEYPLSSRPDRQEAYSPGPLDRIHELQDYLIRHLSRSGVDGSSTALESIRLAFQSDYWLRDYILEAKRNEEAAQIPTLSFVEIKSLQEKNSGSRRLINSIADLHELVREKLTEYQFYLKGDTPAIGDLWETTVVIRPKNEESLSDHLCRFLKLTTGSGLVINREVQIRRKQYSDGTPGSRTDLWVQAIAGDGQSLTLCLEVKCNWNREAKSALQDQLVNKYMSGGTAEAGILVLGWYACPKWDADDDRLSRSTVTWPNASSALADLKNQCTQLKGAGHNVSVTVIDCSLE